ncbi:hypothetical protein MJO29_013762 [Puccinia striiformis f. sp. tritici]|nr:hypothetical protein MJO29_013762 [Puccinia striiformis f. sp. tritici]
MSIDQPSMDTATVRFNGTRLGKDIRESQADRFMPEGMSFTGGLSRASVTDASRQALLVGPYGIANLD